jgi:hypothetical protein
LVFRQAQPVGPDCKQDGQAMLNMTLFLKGLFQFGLILMGAFIVWKIVTSTKGLATHVLGLIVLVTCAIAYFYPNALGE